MHLVSADELDSLVSDILLAAGADDRNASRVAEALVSANLSGVDTHGVLHLPRYVDEIKAGNIVPTNRPEVLKEMPNLKFVLAHGGGTCPLLRGRWEHGWRMKLVESALIDRPPSEYFRLLYFDSLTHSVPALNYLVETVGYDRVMLGSDYPFGMGDFTPPVSVEALPHLSDAQREAIFSDNAIRVFGLNL